MSARCESCVGPLGDACERMTEIGRAYVVDLANYSERSALTEDERTQGQEMYRSTVAIIGAKLMLHGCNFEEFHQFQARIVSDL